MISNVHSGANSLAIFDDDQDILAICTYILEEDGWIIHAFTDCNDIENKIQAVMPKLILMDNWIPDQGGVAATQILKKNPKLQKIPVVYFSANNAISVLAELAGADTNLAKPFELEDLTDAVKRAILNKR